MRSITTVEGWGRAVTNTRKVSLPTRYLTARATEVETILECSGGLDRFLPEPVHAAAERHRHEEDRLSYRASHAVFRLMAAQALGVDPSLAATLPVTRSCSTCGSAKHGKPEIAGVELSLSRSSGTVMVGSAPVGHPIGVDIERIPAHVFKGFDAYTLSTSERKRLRPDDTGARLQLWVGKEALLKATGHGLTVEPHNLTISGNSCNGLPGAEELVLTWVGGPVGYAAAIAAPALLEPRRIVVADLLA